MAWMIRNCNTEKDIYFGWVDKIHCIRLSGGETQECPELFSQQEEADERIAFHISHGAMNSIKSVLVVSPDTDMFVTLLYHLQKPSS